MTFIFFNLLVNSILSLAVGLLIVYFSIWFFRVETNRWKLFLLSLPFVKIVYDFLRGVPEKSVLFTGIDPFSLPPMHQTFSIGAGISGWTPYISGIFLIKDLDGQNYPSSVGDYLLIWIHQNLGPSLPSSLVFLVVLVSMSLLGFRFFQYGKFEKSRLADRSSSSSLKAIKVGRRTVGVYQSSLFSGTPFTGGLFRPYICLPEDAVEKLTDLELQAVIAHEVGHIRYHDLLVTLLIQSLGDLFWFVPGYRWLSRKIDRLREIVADNWAVQSGVEPQFLASALLKLKDIPEEKQFVLYSAFFREKSLLKERVQRLMGQISEKPPRFGWQYRAVRYAVIIIIGVAVLNSVLGGNFDSQFAFNAPEILNRVLDWSCFCVGHNFYALV